MTPNIIIAPCTIEDAPAIAHNNISAFWTDPTWVLIWPGKTLDYVISQAARRMPATLLKDPAHIRHQKAINAQSGAIVGYVRWVLPDGAAEDMMSIWPEARVPAVSESQCLEAERERDAADWDYDRGLDALDEPMMEMKRRLMDGKKYILLDYLAVRPDSRGKGIATTLVKSGVLEAQRMGIDVFVHGMKAGLNVYKRAGFRLLDQIVSDDSMYGGKGEYGSYFLIREVEK